jgi:hypothetical protein
VPFEHCTGGLTSTDQLIQGRKSFRGHSTRPEAFGCMRRHLLKSGWSQIGAREFSPPDGGPIRVLTKKSHYGGLMVLGKGGESGKRFMPDSRKSGNRGVIIG